MSHFRLKNGKFKIKKYFYERQFDGVIPASPLSREITLIIISVIRSMCRQMCYLCSMDQFLWRNNFSKYESTIWPVIWLFSRINTWRTVPTYLFKIHIMLLRCEKRVRVIRRLYFLCCWQLCGHCSINTCTVVDTAAVRVGCVQFNSYNAFSHELWTGIKKTELSWWRWSSSQQITCNFSCWCVRFPGVDFSWKSSCMIIVCWEGIEG